jgi:hypothetical protein
MVGRTAARFSSAAFFGGLPAAWNTTMSFRKKRNHHDEWVDLREALSEEIAQVGLPAGIFRREQDLISFLSTGENDSKSVDLRRIPDQQFLLLEKVVNTFFCDGIVQSSWAVFASERLRRFGRYG